jgi:hypothetical protein
MLPISIDTVVVRVSDEWPEVAGTAQRRRVKAGRNG